MSKHRNLSIAAAALSAPLLLAGMTPAVASAAETTSAASGCADVELIVAGSDVSEADNETLNDIADRVKDGNGNVSVFVVQPDGDSTDYEKSKDRILQEASDRMEKTHEACEDTKFGLLGSLEGAGALGALASQIGEGDGPVDSESVGSTVLLRDPERNGDESSDTTTGGDSSSESETSSPSSDASSRGSSSSNDESSDDSDSTDSSSSGGDSYGTSSSSSSSSSNEPLFGEGGSAATDDDEQEPSEGDSGGTSSYSTDRTEGSTITTKSPSGVYGARESNFGEVEDRTTSLCDDGDEVCAASGSSGLVASAANVAMGDLDATPQLTERSINALGSMGKVLAAVNPAKAASIATNATVMSTAPNPVTGAILAADTLSVAAEVAKVWESDPNLPQLGEFIDLIDPSTELGQKVLSQTPGGLDPQAEAGLQQGVNVSRSILKVSPARILELSSRFATQGVTPSPAEWQSLGQDTLQLVADMGTALGDPNTAKAGEALSALDTSDSRTQLVNAGSADDDDSRSSRSSSSSSSSSSPQSDDDDSSNRAGSSSSTEDKAVETMQTQLF